MPASARPRPLWLRRAATTLAFLGSLGFWARLGPALGLYALTVWALVNVPTVAAPAGLPVAEAAYYAFRFFALDGDGFFPRSDETSENALMWFVLFAAPALTASALFELFLVVRRAVASPEARAEAIERPVVVCGFGTHGRIVAEQALRNGREVVLVDLAAPESDVLVIEGHRVPLIAGSMLDPSTLRAAGADRAEMLFFCAGDPLTNLKAAVLARERVPPVRPGTRLLVPLVDDENAEDLVIECVGRQGIVEFRQFDSAARFLVSRPNVVAALRQAADDPRHAVAIVGFGRFGRALLRAIGAVLPTPADRPALDVLLVDPNASARAPVHRMLAESNGIRLRVEDPSEAERWTAAHLESPPALAFFCTDNDSLNLRCAANLLTGARNAGAHVEVVLRMTSPLREGAQRIAGVTMHSVAELLRADVARIFAEADRAG